MIDDALKFVTAELNSFLLSRTGSDFGKAELGRIVDDSGKCAVAQEHFGVALVNVQEERTLRAQLPETVFVAGQQLTLEPELQLNLHVMFAGNFKLYEQALRQLSLVMTFFQSHSIFTADEYPALNPRIGMLAVELESLSFDQLNQVWGYVGGKQLPSAVYQVRLVALQDLEPSAVQPPITAVSSLTHGR